MILVTVGTQLPFDRLIKIVDRLAPSLGRLVFAQTGRGTYRPANIEWQSIVPPVAFDEMMSKAALIVAHAGIGTVINAQKLGKPLILFPRRAALGEHRNEHQLATARQLAGRAGIYVAHTETDLATLLRADLQPGARGADCAERKTLLTCLESNIAQFLKVD